jgi:hypothetical protein
MEFSKFEFRIISVHSMVHIWFGQCRSSKRQTFRFGSWSSAYIKIFVLRQFGILGIYLIKNRKKWQLTMSQSAVDTPDNVL